MSRILIKSNTYNLQLIVVLSILRFPTHISKLFTLEQKFYTYVMLIFAGFFLSWQFLDRTSSKVDQTSQKTAYRRLPLWTVAC